VLLGITGGIAAYKSAELARIMVRENWQVQVVMTPAATSFISPLTFQSITNRPVGVELFDTSAVSRAKHVDLASFPEVAVVAPATANTLSKLATGMADNLLTSVLLATEAEVVLAPSMNEGMYHNPAVQDNLQLLRSRGFFILEPAEGELACGVEGRGRMPEPAQVYNAARDILEKNKDYTGVRVLVTAGPTRESLDPVRFISNRSTGKMGYKLASAFRERGADVVLVSGPTNLTPPEGVETVLVESTGEMLQEVQKRFSRVQVVAKAAAVSDYAPQKSENKKIKKKDSLSIELRSNPDILKNLGEQKAGQVLVGFAAETNDLLQNAEGKLRAKNLDLIVANDLSEEGAGFAGDTNRVKIIRRDGSIVEVPLMDKLEVSHRILDEILPLLQEQ